MEKENNIQERISIIEQNYIRIQDNLYNLSENIRIAWGKTYEKISSLEKIFSDLERKINEYHSINTRENLKIILQSPISMLQISKRSMNALYSENIKYIYQLLEKNSEELLEIKSLGRQSLWDIKDRLARRMLKLDDK